MSPLLRVFGLGPEHLIGEGGEARVYALSADRVLRVPHGGAAFTTLERRRLLLDRLKDGAAQIGIAIPEVIEQGLIDGLPYVIERRLLGEPLSFRLRSAERPERCLLLRNYLETADRLGDILSSPHPRELCATDPIHAPDSGALMAALAERSLRISGIDHRAIKIEACLGARVSPALVHLDYHPANLLIEGDRITGVLDFGSSTILADRRLNPLVATVYLTPLITPAARCTDRGIAVEWLRARGLAEALAEVERWVAAYWSFAFRDDADLARWGRPLLGLPA